MLLPVHLHEVDDVAQPQPIDDVAQRTAEDQRQRGRQSASARRSRRASQTISVTLTTTASALKTQRCQPEAASNMLKAAPRLCARTRLNTGRQ